MITYPFPQPKHPWTPLWRFVDFAKYAALLSTSTIFFPNVLLMNDPYEGALPSKQKMRDWKQWNELIKETDEEREIERSGLILTKASLFASYISCWYAAPHESDAMWRLFAADFGIGVVTKYSKLINAFPKKYASILSCGLVSYIDYEYDVFEIDLGGTIANASDCLMHKRLEFQHENEFRIIYFDTNEMIQIANELDLGANDSEFPKRRGVTFKVDLSNVIDELVIGPNTPDWIEDVVTSLTEKYGYKFDIRRSKMEGKRILGIRP